MYHGTNATVELGLGLGLGLGLMTVISAKRGLYESKRIHL